MSALGRPAKAVGALGNTRTTENMADATFTARVSVRDSDGVNRTLERTRATRTQAENAVKQAATARVARGTFQGVDSETTIGRLVDIYVADLERNRRLAPQSKARYRQTALTTVKKKWPQLRVRELTQGAVAVFLEELAHEHLAEARLTRTVLRQVLQYAVRANAVQGNAVVLAAVQLATPRKEPRALTVDELNRLRGLIQGWRAGPGVVGPKPTTDLLEIFEVMLATGARISECLAIRREDVFADGTDVYVDINGTIVYESGVGSYRQPHTKTGASAEKIRLTSAAASALRRRAQSGEHELLFGTKTGTPLQQQNLGRQLREILKDTDLAWLTTHVFRKTSGTAVHREKGLAAASKHLRHSNENITQASYVEKDRRADDHTNTLEKLVGRPVK